MIRRRGYSSSEECYSFSASDEEDDGGLSLDIATGEARTRKGERGRIARRRQRKAGSEKKESGNRIRIILMVGALCSIIVFAMLQFRGQTKASSSLRSRGIQQMDVDFPSWNVPHGGIMIPPNSIYRLSVEDANGKMVSLQRFAGLVTLVVNVACLCGKAKITYEQLADLQRKYQSRGFSVLAFPTNDYYQELGSNEKIHEFVSQNFPQVTFPIFGLSSLKANPVYQELERQLPNDRVRHNFYKYLVDRNGVAVRLFSKPEDPFVIEPYIEKLLIHSEEQVQQAATS